MSDILNAGSQSATPSCDVVGHAGVSIDDGTNTPVLRVSIAMTTYNGARFLREQLDSLAAQTKLPFELMIGDDGSTDQTAAIVEAFAATAPFPVHFLRNPTNLGFQANFVETARRCSGELIAFCDQDDIWHADKLARCLTPFADPAVMMVCHDANLIDAQGEGLGKSLVPRVDGVWAPNLKPMHMEYGLTMVYRRSLNDHYDLWQQSSDENSPGVRRSAHDQWFYFLAIVLGKVVYVDECLIDYRQHESNLVGAFPHKLNLTPAQRNKYMAGRVRTLQDRIRFMHALRDRAAPKYRAEMDDRIRDSQKALKIWDARTRVYGDGGIFERMSAIATLVMNGGYSKREFEPRGFVADIVFGMFRYTPGKRATVLYAKMKR